MGGGDVQKDQLIAAGFIVSLGSINWIAHISQIDKVDALDHPAVFDIQTGNDSFFQHG